MTGFGISEAVVKECRYRIEIKSLNSKGLDFSLKLAPALRDVEWNLRKQLTPQLIRGKVDVQIIEEKKSAAHQNTINFAVLDNYFSQLEIFAKQKQLPIDGMLAALLQMPDVLSSENVLSNEDDQLALNKGIQIALEAFFEFRKQEGSVLEADLTLRVKTILNHLTEIEPFENERIQRIRQKIYSELEQAKTSVQFSQDRLEQEMIFYLEKLDITEEKVRLKAHCEYFMEAMSAHESIEKGKKLGFIAQEMGREVNTIGSKASDAGIQKIVVLMKEEVEKIKEQVNNIL